MHPAGLFAALLAPLVAAHGHHDVTMEMAERRAFLRHNNNNLNHCASQIVEQELGKRATHRRAGLVSKLAKRSGVEERNLKDLASTLHHSDENYTMETDPAVLFAGGGSCVLNPEATEGPFYVAGEFIRQDIVDGEAGVPLAVDVQVLDIETCKPVPDAYFEIWHCNTTGVYSGIVSFMNGLGDADPDNIDTTFHRGLQQLDADGAAQFHTVFPGHYEGRATHIHIMLHMGAMERDNGTVMDLSAAHVGQMYFDQDLVNEVEQLDPYKENTVPVTPNTRDVILAAEAFDADPFMHYVRLGDCIEDGVLAWLSLGVNTTYERNVSEVATMYEEGGQMNEDAPLECFAGGFPPMPTGTEKPQGLPKLSGGFAIPSGGCGPSDDLAPKDKDDGGGSKQ